MHIEVKVAIEWNGNTVGLHPDPMTVHIAGKADPNEIIGAVAKVMGAIDQRDDKKSDHIEPEHDGGGSVSYVDGGWEPSFPAFRMTADFNGHECGGCSNYARRDYWETRRQDDGNRR